MTEVGVLGPVEIRRGGVPVAVRGNQPLAVLAMLAVARGRPVAADRLADDLWGAAAPPGAHAVLQAHISRLRRALEPERPPRGAASLLVSEGAGYALRLPAGALDAERFETAVRASAGLTPADELARLEAALAIWRGRPYEQFADAEWAAAETARLTELRHIARERAVTSLLRLGRPGDAALAARELTGEEPLRGEPWRLHALALWAGNRSADALAVLAAHRRLVAAELGLDPEPAMVALEQAILGQRADVLETALRPSDAVRPAQLPRSPEAFSGRDDELRRLDKHSLVVISGTGGLGKTTLAVRWAHEAAARYPDGQLYGDLRGYCPMEPPAEPGDILGGFLGALGQRVPPSTEERSALLRSVLAGRRMLIVLDNARDADQVRPLLPGAPGCAVVVTSRSRLGDLVVADGAYAMHLSAFSDDEAVAYLRRRLGPAADADIEARDAIVARCGGLPLALALICARAASSPAPLREIEAGVEGLDAFAVTGVRHDLRAVFSWSYRGLAAPAARLFRLLPLHPGAEVSVEAAAALAGVDPAVARVLLRRLVDAHLIAEPRPGRFTLHDLLRAYAREIAPPESGALRRLLEFYLHSARSAALLHSPYRHPVMVGPGPAGLSFAGPAAGTAWLDDEYENLGALLELCRTPQWSSYLPPFVWVLTPYQQDLRFHLADSLTLCRDALAVASDRWWVGYLHYVLGRGLLRLDRPAEARAELAKAIAVGRASGDPVALANALLGVAESIVGTHSSPTREQAAEAYPFAAEARELYVRLGNDQGRAEVAGALHPLAWHHAWQPDGRAEALRLFEATRHPDLPRLTMALDLPESEAP